MSFTIDLINKHSVGKKFQMNALVDAVAQTSNSKIHPYLQTVLLDAASTDMIDVYATLSIW